MSVNLNSVGAVIALVVLVVDVVGALVGQIPPIIGICIGGLAIARLV